VAPISEPRIRILDVRRPSLSLRKVSPILGFLLLERPTMEGMNACVRETERSAKQYQSLTVTDSLVLPGKKGSSARSGLLDR
jgi:hypothetical protein